MQTAASLDLSKVIELIPIRLVFATWLIYSSADFITSINEWIMRRIPVTADIILGRMRTIDGSVKDKVSVAPADYRVELDEMLEALKQTEMNLSDAMERSQVTGIRNHLERLDEQWLSLQNLVAKQTESVSLLPALSGIC